MSQQDKKIGRPKIEILEHQLKVVCRNAITLEECAEYFNVSADTIERRCREWGYSTFAEFKDKSFNYTRFAIKKTLLHMALKQKNVTALIYCSKNFCDMSDLGPQQSKAIEKKPYTYLQFCENAGYPKPFIKQLEMMDFCINGDGARLLLGSRGYGKTDYVTILGVAYDVYLDYFNGTFQMSWLIVTKSELRNAAILEEIGKALVCNGVELDKSNAEYIRVKGLHGKDPSIAAITLKSGSKRGRHPKKILMDDPVTEEDVYEAARRVAQRTYNELFKLTENICIIGQPVHKSDLYETLRPLVNKLEMPHGTIPELDHDLEAQKLAGVTEESISSSYHLKVISESASPFENVNIIDNYPMGDSVAFIDPSFEGHDYTALTISRSHFSGVAVIGFVFKKSWDSCIDQMTEKMIKFGVKRVCFETNSLGDFPLNVLRLKLPPSVGVVGKKSTNNKHSRIMNAGIFASSIYISKQSDRLYLDHVKGYEYGCEYDDAPDSLASLLEWIGLVKGKK